MLLLSANDYLLLSVKVDPYKFNAVVLIIVDSKCPDLLKIVGGATKKS
jgi:hypothetical protein